MRKRKAVEAIEQQKHQLITALYSNPNWDDEKAKRPEKIQEIEQKFDEAIKLVYNPELANAGEQEIDWDSPFWAAAKRSQERIFAARPELRNKTVKEGMAYEMDQDQIDARNRSRREVDQAGLADR